MKSSKRIALFVLVTVAVGVGFSWWVNHQSVPQDEVQLPPSTKTSSVVQPVLSNSTSAVPRPLYGKASLNGEEKQILHKAFEDVWMRDIKLRAYRVGVICLKHRLNYWEVNELVDGRVIPAPHSLPPDGARIHFQMPISNLLVLDFEQNGNLKRVYTVYTSGTDVEFPPLESVTPETSIEPPPKATGDAP